LFNPIVGLPSYYNPNHLTFNINQWTSSPIQIQVPNSEWGFYDYFIEVEIREYPTTSPNANVYGNVKVRGSSTIGIQTEIGVMELVVTVSEGAINRSIGVTSNSPMFFIGSITIVGVLF